MAAATKSAAGAGRPGRRRGVHRAGCLPGAAGRRAAGPVGRPAGPPARWPTGPPAAARSTACWTRRSSRSSSWPRSGARSTAPIASSPTAAPGWAGCGCRRPACIGCWPPMTWCCRRRPAGRRSSAALAGLDGVSAQSGVGLGRDPLRPLPGRPRRVRDHRPGQPQVAGHPAQRRGDLHPGPGRVLPRARGRRADGAGGRPPGRPRRPGGR